MSDRIVVGQVAGGGNLYIDIPALVDTRALITGNSGAGKSRLLRRIAEQAFGKVQQIVIDPEGEFPSLREKHAFALAGRGGEMPAEPRAAALMARRIMELRISVVLDLYDLRLPQQREFVRIFLDSLMALDKTLYRPVLVMIDEAHKFAPERSAGEAESTEAVIALMSQGRKRGLCGIPATQRLSKLHKDAAAEGNNVFVGRTVLDVDQKRAADALGITGPAERIALRDLENGTFLAFGPALDAKGVVTFQGGEVHTTHPKAGQRHKAEPPAPPEAVKKLAAELKDIPEQAAEEIRTLTAAQARVRELERELRAAKKAQPPAPPAPKAPRVVERPVLKDAQAKRLEAVAIRFEKAVLSVEGTAEAVYVRVQEVKAALAAARDTERERGAGRPGVTPGTVTRPAPTVSGRGIAALIPDRQPAARSPRGNDRDGSITPAQQRILDALAWLESVGLTSANRAQLALLADQSPTSSSYANNLGALRSSGRIDYGGGSTVMLTDDGRAVATPPDVAPTSEAVQQSILRRLTPAKARILQALIRVYPQGLTRAALADLSNQSATSSSYANNLGSLRSLGVIDYSGGEVVALPLLFVGDR